MAGDENRYGFHANLVKTGTTQNEGTTHAYVHAKIISPLNTLKITTDNAKGFAQGASDKIEELLSAVSDALNDKVSTLEESNSSTNTRGL